MRFLHQEMGFDVLAWESGLLQTYALNAALRDPAMPLDKAKAYLMSGGWAGEEGVHPVFEYARATWTTTRPLEMTGFDTGSPRMSTIFFRQFFTSLSKRAAKLALTDEEWTLVERLNKRGYGFISGERPNEVERTREWAVLQGQLRKLRGDRPELLKTLSELELAVAERFVTDALASEQINYVRKTEGTGPANYARDRFMADTLRWVIHTLYPTRKIIVWAATSHLVRNSNLIENQKQKDAYATAWEMGNHLYPMLGDNLYTIAFSAYGGKLGQVFPEGYGIASQASSMADAPAGSFEALAHELKQPYLFVDLRQVPTDHWLRGKFMSVSLGRNENIAPWSQIVDAFFFVDQAEPVRYLPKSK